MKTLSKTKLLALRQCAKRLWLEINNPDAADAHSTSTEARFKDGHRVGSIARRIYDPLSKGYLINTDPKQIDKALVETAQNLAKRKPIFEAGFRAQGLLSFADVLLPTRHKGNLVWKMIEVKSSTEVKNYHRDDAAIQAYIVRSAGLPLKSISLAYIDSTWVYEGDGDYTGFLIEEDLTHEAFARAGEVQQWSQNAQVIIASATEPDIKTGAHCTKPYDCNFQTHCKSQEPQAEYPIAWLPGRKSASFNELIQTLEDPIDMRDIDDEHLNDIQRKVKAFSLSGKTFFNKKAAFADLAKYKLPALFLDFETINPTVPRWQGTRPYQQIPFQFSAHHLSRTGKLTHKGFLRLDGKDPSRAFATALIEVCQGASPIFVYNAGFEGGRIQELAARLTRLSNDLLAIKDRLVDLYPIAKAHYYHPKQQGSWSIKQVLPAVVPKLNYSKLDGVKDGGMAMDAFAEATDPNTTKERYGQLYEQLWRYCELDTYAMVKIWQTFAQRKEFKL